jgi:sigma-B regulation protein RsbU (phosphoserine phosphatase)
MIMETIANILGSPLTAKLLMLAAVFVALSLCRKRDLEGVSNIILAVLPLLAVRDILFTIFPISEIFLVSDVILFAIYGFFVFRAYGKKILSVAFVAVNLVFLLAFTANLLFAFAVDLPPAVYLSMLGLDLVALLVLSALSGKSAQTLSAQVAFKVAAPFLCAYAVYAALAALLGYDNFIVQRVAVPASYFILIYYCVIFLVEFEKEGQSERDHLNSTVDSIYAFMEGTGAMYSESLDMEPLLKTINAAMIKESEADGGLIAMVDEFDDIVAVKVMEGDFAPPFKLPADLPRKKARVEALLKHAQFSLGESIFGESVKTGGVYLRNEPASDSRVFVNGEEDFLSFSSLMVVPFNIRGKVVGIQALERKQGNAPFSDEIFERVKMLADYGAIVIRNSQFAIEAAERANIEKEAAISEDIQRTLLPKKLPDIGNLCFGSFSQTAHGVYSDYFDVIQNRKDRLSVIMSDVAGKGVHASVIMAMVRAILHLVTNTDKDAATVLTWINRGITGKIEMDHFATMGVLVADPETGLTEFSSAASQAPLVYRAAGNRIETLEAESVPIGVESKTEYRSERLVLAPEDFIVLYSDGVIEVMNDQGKQYGRKRLTDVILKNAHESPKELAMIVRQDIQDFIGQTRPHDDQSLLIMKLKA